MPAYFIAHRRKITDSDKLKHYRDGIDETIGEFGGKVIAREDSFDVLEGDWASGQSRDDSRPERITIIRFPDMNALRSWYDSDAYAGLRDIRLSSSYSDVVAVEGSS